ncbi:MAG: epoxyqueuosine reductase, partial [Deltaproteobacteria bacterium]|nr:epoxyqueuosine reductase [Deltaproteobacteria bacterium]
RAHAAWALGRISDLQAKTKLEEAKITEKNPDVLEEIEAALAVFNS